MSRDELYGPTRPELERAMLRRLNFLAATPAAAVDANCLYCGYRPRSPLLCDDCERRRARLAAAYPDVPQLKPFAEVERAQLEQPATEYPAQPTIHVGPPEYRLPYNDPD